MQLRFFLFVAHCQCGGETGVKINRKGINIYIEKIYIYTYIYNMKALLWMWSEDIFAKVLIWHIGSIWGWEWCLIPRSILRLTGTQHRDRKWSQQTFWFLWEGLLRWRLKKKKKEEEEERKKKNRVVWPIEVASHFTSSSAILSLTVIQKFNKCSLFVLADFKQIHL